MDLKEKVSKKINEGKYDGAELENIESNEEMMFLGGLLGGLLAGRNPRNENLTRCISRISDRDSDIERRKEYMERAFKIANDIVPLSQIELSILALFLNYDFGDRISEKEQMAFFYATQLDEIQKIVVDRQDYIDVENAKHIEDLIERYGD